MTFRPFRVREIRNKYLRRAVMLVLFIPMLFGNIFINTCFAPFSLLINICNGFVILWNSFVEVWNIKEEQGND